VPGVTEIEVLEGLLCWDGRVLELFRRDGRQGSWRLHGTLVTAVRTEVLEDRLEVRFHTTPAHYESVQVAPEAEAALRALIAALDRA
jgi:hypothetical protein